MKKNFLCGTLFVFCAFSSELPQTQLAEQVTEHLADILKSAVDDTYIGEDISQLTHAEQAAYQASLRTEDEDVMIAALLHDLGHRLKNKPTESMNGYGAKDHETIGAHYLRSLGFSEKICILVQEHARAKRYLSRHQDYYQALSYASQQTLIFQGGILSDAESHLYEKEPFFQECVLLRLSDDAAKDPTAIVPSYQTYKKILIKHLESEFQKDLQKQLRVQAFIKTTDFQMNSR